MAAQQRLVEANLDHETLPPTVRALVERDNVMRGLVAAVGPYALRTQKDPWVALASAIIYQQVSGRVAAGAVRKLCTTSAGEFPSPSRLSALSPAAFRSAGLTQRKEQTLRDIAVAVEADRLDLGAFAHMGDDAVVETLCSWKGIGPWTAHMFLVFHLGRQDVIMPGDLGIRKAIAYNYGLPREPTPDEVKEIAARWSPARTVASWYLWKSIPGFPEPGFA